VQQSPYQQDSKEYSKERMHQRSDSNGLRQVRENKH